MMILGMSKKSIPFIILTLLVGFVIGSLFGFYLSSQRDKKAFLAEKKAFQELYKKTQPFKHIKNLPSNKRIIQEDIRKLQNAKAAFAKEEPIYVKGKLKNQTLTIMRQTRAVLLDSQTSMLVFMQQYIDMLKSVKKLLKLLIRAVSTSFVIVACGLCIFLIKRGYS